MYMLPYANVKWMGRVFNKESSNGKKREFCMAIDKSANIQIFEGIRDSKT